MNHTPGPWEWTLEDPTRVYAQGKLIANTVATGHEATVEDIANAKLIASLPELLLTLDKE